MPMKAVVPKREPAVAETAAVENMAAVKAAAMEHGATAVETAAVKRRASTMEAAATAVKSTSAASMPAATMPATAVAAAAMTTAADFGQPVGGVRHRRRRARTDQRQRFRALVGCGRQQQHRDRRKAQRTNKGADQPAPRIWNFHHARNLPGSATKALAVQRPAFEAFICASSQH